jgi:hypothetical protein
VHTTRGRKRKVRTFEPSQAFDTPPDHAAEGSPVPLPIPPRYPWLLKGALNALVADERTVDGPEDLTTEAT